MGENLRLRSSKRGEERQGRRGRKAGQGRKDVTVIGRGFDGNAGGEDRVGSLISTIRI